MKPRSNITNFLLIAFGVLAFAVAVEIFLAPAGGQRPDIEQALEDFLARYSEAAVHDIRITRDEVTARSFEIEYRNKVTGDSGRLDFHYTDRGDGKWTMQPEPPAQLP